MLPTNGVHLMKQPIDTIDKQDILRLAIQDYKKGVKDVWEKYGMSRSRFFKFYGRYKMEGDAGLLQRSKRNKRAKQPLQIDEDLGRKIQEIVLRNYVSTPNEIHGHLLDINIDITKEAIKSFLTNNMKPCILELKAIIKKGKNSDTSTTDFKPKKIEVLQMLLNWREKWIITYKLNLEEEEDELEEYFTIRGTLGNGARALTNEMKEKFQRKGRF